ncbi:hypothetical protein E2C01_066432 [Portunus trituberculatus]|uniref:Uncharacterized protein n=1 Tax=Portunus trituberculatus TaxID=210409 RepID=A0A5B7HTU4_PORTR|nr:hypothetical protein [Portunus trituberculatus]
MMVDSARVYQAKLERHHTRCAHAKHQGSVGTSGSRVGAGDMPHGVVQVDSPSSQVRCLRQSVWLALDQPPQKHVAPSRVQEALLAKGARGGNL